MKKILYYGGCWPTNIGNAFIDIGSIYTIKTAMPSAQVNFASEFPKWHFKNFFKKMKNSISLAELMKIDFIVISGMNLCNEFIKTEGPVIKKLSKIGVKVIFNGCGGAEYDKNEVNNFKKFLAKLNVVGFIARDPVSYKNYKDCFPKSYNGIDCAFFLPDTFKPAKFRSKNFVILNFDHRKEPKIAGLKKKIIRTHHVCLGYIPKSHFSSQNTLISDIPEDYLNLYANAFATYSDRVHACIAALSFGNFAQLFSDTPRAFLFENVKANKVKNKLIKINTDFIAAQKEKQIIFLKKIFNEKAD